MKKKHTTILVLFLLSALFIYKYGLHKPDRKLPTIVATFPRNYTQTVAVDIKNIKFVFSEEMETSLAFGYVGKQLPIGTTAWEDAGQTILSVPIRGPLPYQTSYTFVLNPDNTLRELTGMPVSNSSMKDVAGNELAPFFFTFRTELSPETKELRNKYIFNDLFDTDEDGLEDELELKIGTDPAQVDSDADGLMDYDEYCKYRTDATKSDSDGDGKTDGDWDERREYTYTIRAICEINDPINLEDMNDLFQDVRVIAERTSTSHTRYEIFLYPDSEPHLLPTKFPYQEVSATVKKYTQRGFATNFSPEMQTEIRHMISDCRSDLEVIERIQFEMAQMHLVYEGAAFLYCRVEEGNQLVMVQNPLKDLKPKARRVFRTPEQLLNGIFYGDSMFKSRQHGVCDSRATLRTTMLRAAGIPTRLTLAIPLVYCYRGKEEELTRNLKRESLRSGYVSIAPKSPKQVSIVNHNYTEVYVNNKWIRLDQDLNEGPIFNDKYLFLKIISFADWADVDFTRSWSREKWFTHRPYKTLELSDTFAKYPAVYGNKSLNSGL